ncbi:glycosyltransferase family 4 protein [Rubellicoccus peritrichatus]|uniref:Glycosyltransferase family 4 protein n=1 Tax=Rubellicoccus peritrichatus TaxID=3080537 RepID=A0AAQ3L8X6_9BACT|nr:glycosyltransferase family 4 protein [Puniceicoccus sp. CR14]WOO39460.1 glycosyltransferase family 4 protein [Puniceicoccus sp. CR14]
MRIAIVQDYLRGGGTEKHSILLANFFHERDYEVVLMRFRPGGALESRLKAPSIVLQPFDTRLNFLAPGLFKQLIQWKPDVVLCMGHEANLRVAAIKRRLPGIPVVGTLRSGKPLTRRLFLSAKAADAVVANSNWASQRAQKKGITAAKLHLINNLLGFNIAELAPQGAGADIRREFDTKDDDAVLINVAGFRRKKGQAELLAMLSPILNLGGVVLWLVGDGPELERCRKLAIVLGVAGAVRFTGRRDDVFELLKAADICVHASRTESQPNALIEAQSAGLPVVALDIAGVGEAFQHGHSGVLIKSNDTAGFLEAVTMLIRDPKVRDSYGRAGREFALAKFDDGRNSLAYVELFEELVGPEL